MENEKNNQPAHSGTSQSPEQPQEHIETIVPSTHQPEKTDQDIVSHDDQEENKEEKQPASMPANENQPAQDQAPATDETAEEIEEDADERQRRDDRGEDERDEVETVTPRS